MDRGRIAAGMVSLTAVSAAIGYVAATGFLLIRDYGIDVEIDFLWLARSYLGMRKVRPEDFELVSVIIGAFTLLGLLVGALLSGNALTRFGVTRWQTSADMKRNGFFAPPGTGFILGKLGKPGARARFITSRVFPHALIVAPTGRGKTSGFVIPNLLTFKGAAVVLDVKGENFEATARHRASQGDRIYRFAPADWHDRRTHRYNPLLRIFDLEDPDRQQMELQLLASLFLQSENDKVQGLLKGRIDLFVAAGLLAFERKRLTLGEIYRITAAGDNKQKQYRDWRDEVQNEAKVIFTRMASTNNDTLTSYVSLLMTSGLDQWSNPAIDAATRVSDFDFRTIRKRPFTVYLVVAPNMVKPLAPLIRLFFSDLISSLQDKEPGKDEPWPVMILLDEFNRLGKMPIVVESIETLRSYRGHLAIVTQTIPALDELYGENTRRALQGNAGVKLYLTPSDEKTVEELSKAVGKTTKRVVARSRSIGRNPFEGRSLSERTEESALLPEDEARRMPLDEIVLVIDAQMPIRARRIQYFADPYFKAIHAAQTGELPFPPPDLKPVGAPATAPAPVAEPVEPLLQEGTPAASPPSTASASEEAVDGVSIAEASARPPRDVLRTSRRKASSSVGKAKNDIEQQGRPAPMRRRLDGGLSEATPSPEELEALRQADAELARLEVELAKGQGAHYATAAE